MTDDKHVFQPGDLVLVSESPSLEDGSDWEILSLLSRYIGSVVTGIPDGDGDILVEMGMSDGPELWYIGKSHLTPVSNESLQGGAE